jgi:hypothetical protein
MPLLSLYVSYVITVTPVYFWASVTGSEFSLRRWQQKLVNKSPGYCVSVTYRPHYWILFWMMISSFCASMLHTPYI